VIAASGVLHHPRLPEIAGLDTFAGPAFHTARWDDQAPIEGARVGLIGSGSTGIQIVTAINRKVERLVHFQRSPQWVMPVPQFRYSDEEREAFRRDPALIDAIRFADEYLGNIRRFTDAITDIDGPQMLEIERICRDHFEASVRDPELKEKLRPNYRAACKRLIYSWCYFDEVQHPAVFVETGSIARVEPQGVRRRDRQHRPRRAAGGPHGGRHVARARHLDPRHRLPRRPLHPSGWRDRRGRDDARPVLGDAADCALRGDVAPTCSCSTAPPGRSATSR
jgi:cation diffusion facilitator CzcD-associated flavoprotein CzcO